MVQVSSKLDAMAYVFAPLLLEGQERIGRVSPAVLQEMLTELDKLTGQAE
jgi:hypothetical protein